VDTIVIVVSVESTVIVCEISPHGNVWVTPAHVPANLLVGRGAGVALGFAALLDDFDSAVRLGLDLAARSCAGVGFSSTIGAGDRCAIINIENKTIGKRSDRRMVSMRR